MAKPNTEEEKFAIPILQGVLPFNRATLPAEVLAGLTFACLAIPEVMGYTKIAGTPVVTGLYTILIPMALFALFGSSRHLVVGADSATAAITASALAGMAVSGSSEYLALASLLALMAAVLLIAARIIGLGFLADFLSRTVLVGFLTGVGIQVATGEIPGLMGINTEGHGTIAKLKETILHMDQTSWPTLAVSLAVLAVVVGCRRVSPKLPGPLFAILGVIICSWAFQFTASGIAVLGAVPSGLPALSIPDVDWSWNLFKQLLPTALSIFVVILAQSAATSRAYAARYEENFSENTDLVGLGLANLGAAFTGTFVVNGSPTKTEMVASAGGRSQVAQLTTVLIVLVVILFLTGPLAYLPNAALSAVVFLIGVKLIDLKGLTAIYKQARSEFWIAVATAAVVVFVGVEQGIIFAMVLSLIDHTRRGYRPKNSVIVKNDGGWHSKPISAPNQFEPGLVIYRFSHSLYYANTQRLSDEVTAITRASEAEVQWFCIEASAIDDVDFTAGYTLRNVQKLLRAKNIKLVFLLVEPHVRSELNRYGVTALVGDDAYFDAGSDLLSAFHRSSVTA
ncbi:SulP family inorganic anion transporter [Ruegeria sp. Ofav3-42]|uniref:SulP family inorganic anion transporter n=1 Tax=Ruegeria sp. Ofav3-42 TaxID=2917759 RepID=UPI001EF60861|nr:SulP family inorganic anion transporter [Ruegeria sp. Ofav3-42]MCG7518703.1 SulP family inorganic anion transporter [Ruegeria sp. Ofav3-42]